MPVLVIRKLSQSRLQASFVSRSQREKKARVITDYDGKVHESHTVKKFVQETSNKGELLNKTRAWDKEKVRVPVKNRTHGGSTC